MTPKNNADQPSNSDIYLMARRVARYMSTRTKTKDRNMYEVYEDDKIEITAVIGGTFVAVRLKRQDQMKHVYAAHEDTKSNPGRLNRGRWVTTSAHSTSKPRPPSENTSNKTTRPRSACTPTTTRPWTTPTSSSKSKPNPFKRPTAMNIADLRESLSQQDEDRYVVLRDPGSGLVHSLKFLIEETVTLNAGTDLRTGPHSLTYKISDSNTPILHFGQQGWYGDYPPTPDMETVAQLAVELEKRDQNMLAVVTHHFDEFVDVDVVLPLDDMAKPVLWGNPGSNVSPWPTANRQAPPSRVLLISNRENEAYSQLKRAITAELDAGILQLQASRPNLQGITDLPLGSRTVTRTELRESYMLSSDRLRKAWTKLTNIVAGA